MNLNIILSHVAMHTGTIFTKFQVSQSVNLFLPELGYNFLTVDMLRRAVTLYFDTLILDVCSVLSVT